MVKSRQFALIYRTIAFIIAIAGFLSMSGIAQGDFAPGIMMFYTMQSNLIGIALFGVLIYKTISDLRNNPSGHPGYYPQLVMVVSVILLITLIVYWAMLAPQTFTMTTEFDLWSFGNLAVHTYTPLLVLLDYILFSPPGHLRYRDVYYILIYPFGYVMFTSIIGFLGHVYYISPSDGLPVRFPYFFYDFDRIGAWGLVFIAVLMLFFLMVGHVYYLIDKWRRANRP